MRHSLGPELFVGTGVNVVAGPALLVMIVGHTSAKKHQKTLKNKIYYSDPEKYRAYLRAIQ